MAARLVFAVALALPAVALADDREDMLRQFDELKRNAKAQFEAYQKVTPLARASKVPVEEQLIPPLAGLAPVRTPAGEYRNMVRVWAELRKSENDKTGTGEYVSLSGYRWRRDQPFILWVDAPSPVRVALFNVQPDGKRDRVLPTDGEKDDSWKPKKDVFNVPIGLVTEAHGDDEEIVIFLMAAGDDSNPRPKVKDQEITALAVRNYLKDVDRAFTQARGLQMEPSKADESKTPKDVALVGRTGDVRGIIPLTLRKKK